MSNFYPHEDAKTHFFYEETEGGHSAGANLKEKARTNALELTYFARQLRDQ